MSDKESKPSADKAASGRRTGVGPSGEPGKRSRTQALPPSRVTAAGASTLRVQPEPAVARFELTEIGRESYADVTLTNVSDEEVDFFDFLQTILPARDGIVRPEGDFAVVGGETSGEGLEPGASTAVTLAFHPIATGPDDLDKGRKTPRKARLAIIDEEGAIAGTVPLEGTARPPSSETLDEAAISDARNRARGAGRSSAVPRSFDDMRRSLLAARDLMSTSERDEAAELLDGVAARLEQSATYEHVYAAARKHGLGAITATKMVGDARAEISNLARKLHGDLTVLPAHLDTAVTLFEAAKEPIQLSLGEIERAPALQAMNDATPAVVAGRAVEELGETAAELATDAAFAAGFGLGALEGAGGALVDLAAGVGDAARLAFDLARAWLRGGMIGMTFEVATKAQAFFTKTPGALQGMGAAFQEGWNAPDSYARGNFRGEVISYVAAQIAIIVISGGAASEGVAFASLSRWGKVARVIQAVDAAGDVATWANAAARSVEIGEGVLDAARRARASAAGSPAAPRPAAASPPNEAPRRGRPPEDRGDLGPLMANKGSKLVHTSREEALHDLLQEARRENVAIISDDEAIEFLAWAERRDGAPPGSYHAVTLGDTILVRPEHAANVRVLREELIHVFQQRRGVSSADVVVHEIEARLMMIKYRHRWGLTISEVREMIEEVRRMRRTGEY